MAFSFHQIFFLIPLFFLPLISPSPTSSTIPISLFNPIPPSDPFQKLTHLASTSIARAHHIKNPQNAPVSTTPLYPYTGAYSISLSFGTPPQSIPLIMDTGSSFSWIPCTNRYVCRNCNISSTGVSSFIPKQSSSSQFIGCLSPKCGWLHKSFDPTTSCSKECQLNKTSCTQICPPYIILYGLGSTGGIAMVETLDLGNMKIQDFLVGCSLFSSRIPAGLAGFGRGISSVPSQLGLKKFSYCLVSHKFDNTPKSSLLYMDTESDTVQKTENFSYTPLLKNPAGAGNGAVSEYYYVGLRKITVGGKKVKFPYEKLNLDGDGNGGTIVDSGSTFSYMNQEVFEAVGNEFVEQVKGYKRAVDVESATGLRPCFDVAGDGSLELPELRIHFKGSSEMGLPMENVFIVVSDGGGRMVVCLTLVTDGTLFGPDVVSGPSVILGNFMMQNFHVEYDLRNERLGFRQESCS